MHFHLYLMKYKTKYEICFAIKMSFIMMARNVVKPTETIEATIRMFYFLFETVRYIKDTYSGDPL